MKAQVRPLFVSVASILLGLLGASGCSSSERGEPTEVLTQGLTLSCPTNRIVVRQPAQMRCEDYQAWIAIELSLSSTSRFCAYQLGRERPIFNEVVHAPVADPASLGDLYAELVVRVKNSVAGTPADLKISDDCPVVFGRGAPTDKVVHAAFRGAVGRLNDMASARALLHNGSIDVDVLDAAAIPYGASCGPFGCGLCQMRPPSDRNPHGRAMGRIIAETACAGVSDERCFEVANIANHLVLPIAEATPNGLSFDYTCGGHIGRLSDLALAIDQIAQQSGDSAANHIVNLSVAWSPKVSSVGSEAVFLALRRASCAGVLVIAAAGNTHGDDGIGPMLPAAWEAFPAPSARECRELGLFTTTRRARVPLVYAVSSLDYGNELLGTVRELGRSRIEALGMGGVAREPRLGETGFTGTYTGSSVSAAIVSGIAATLWKAKPELGPHEVMAQIYGTGRDLNWPQDFGLEGITGPARARAASLCSTVAKNGIHCEDVKGYPNLKTSSFLGEKVQDALPCDDPGAVCDSKAPAYLDGPWLGPQPDEPSCPHCSLFRKTGVLSIVSNKGLVSNFRLETNGVETRYSLPAPLSAGSAVYYHNAWMGGAGALPSQATLEILDTVSGAVRDEPVLISD